MRIGPRALVWVALGLAVSGCSSTPDTIEIGIRYSRFRPASIEVRGGSTVSFTVRNDDPIAHEFIIGTAEEQAEHEKGTELTHDGAPGAASLAPGETETIRFDFAERGTLEFACHIPGHYRFGMRGTIEVV